jgi:general secretion pathway protein G
MQIKMKKNKQLNNDKGFTLVEILIVVSIIGGLMGLLLPKVMDSYNRSQLDTTKIMMRNVATALDSYYRDCSSYPTTDQGLQALVEKPTSGKECPNYDPSGYSPTKKKIPADAWGRPFDYESDGTKYVLKSQGKDKREGGSGYDADISSEDLN